MQQAFRDWSTELDAPLHCPCGAFADEAQPIISQDEESGRIFYYRRCASCTLERLFPRPSAKEIGSYYPVSYAPHVGFAPNGLADKLKRLVYKICWANDEEVGRIIGAWRPLLRILFYPIRYRTALSFTPPEIKKVFEFGAARGTDLLAFKAAGWEAFGCEPSKQACELAAARGIALQNATAEDALLACSEYSCILLNNVFEHVHDPIQVLTKCHNALRPGGLLVMIVPNHACLSAKLFGAAWPGYDAPRHLWGWTAKALKLHLCKAGFEICHIHHQATGSWLWRSMLDMRHSPRKPGRLRLWLARHASGVFVPASILAAAFGKGDFIRIVARRTERADHAVIEQEGKQLTTAAA